ncbi:TIR domain-containing protein [Vibrio sp. 2-2(8)]|uniref:TIR domain-containing protein n=1 Tax=Vibrio sp. 2-2(8) TaxID=2591014 RepID=UPI0014829154|nr:TIR domain-containing protein [Vibrio sp. 2-2(8)]EGR0264758.1 toll/interleukin-1 receptor domain-containing protein [Vibrio cholerae]NNN49774.1 toll/interleukin-1 receptor domain-containing protein [Vibrio sp. 2-2(8)]
MKIFISWSGDTSRRVAEAIREWLPTVLQTVKPYFTPSDIEKGTRWSSDIAGELDNSMAGIFCVTHENLNSQWLMFEAGAISKKVDQSLVCPILIGMDNSDINGPLTQFQTTLFDKADFKRLVFDLNKANSSNVLNESVLNIVFEKFWPELEDKVSKIISSVGLSESKFADIRSDREILEEVLDLSRALAIQKSGGFKSHKELNDLISEFLMAYDAIFRMDWQHTKLCLEDSDIFISPYGNFIEPHVENEGNNWGNRPYLLNSYRELVNYIRKNNIDIRTEFS